MISVLSRLRSRLSPQAWRYTLLALGPVVVLVILAVSYLTGGQKVSSNNAYLKAGKVQISADVAGRVIQFSAAENEYVRKGDLLFRIDPTPFEIAVAHARAELATARSQIVALRARYLEMGAELESAQADAAFAEREYDRQARLARTHVASDAKLDAADQARAKARQNIAAIEQQRAAVLAALDGNADGPIDANSSYRAAQAMLDQAELDLRHCTVFAPSDGLLSQTDNFRPGLYVKPGEALFSLVQSDVMWVEANLKETEINDIRPGQPARVKIDAYPGRVWKAEVDSLSAGTGAEFALLPPQNATGNWVKVTQRVPVRLKLQRRRDDPPLRIGMTAHVEIDTHERKVAPKPHTVADTAPLASSQ